jgi:hypothetical protein
MGRMMRYSQAEKLEIIRLVEASDLSVKPTLVQAEAPNYFFVELTDQQFLRSEWLYPRAMIRRIFARNPELYVATLQKLQQS